MEDSKTLQVVSFAPQLRHLPYFRADAKYNYCVSNKVLEV